MSTSVIIILLGVGIWLIFKLLNYSGEGKDRSKDTYDKRINKKKSFSFRLFTPPLPFDDKAVTWCSNFLVVDKKILEKILRDPSLQYLHFKLGKRRGGVRIISAPGPALLSIQKTIYKRVLLPVNIHPVAKGFRQKMSIVDNAKPHLGKKEILKVDIRDYFGSISIYMVIATFKTIGYPYEVAKVLGHLCTLKDVLPQGAPTSPALSNIITYNMDSKLLELSSKNGLTYTRYADDLTFSGENISTKNILPAIKEILAEERFEMKNSKTRYLTEKKRKIVTGISISSGNKLTIPKAKKREVRKNVHFILTKGLAEHQKYIGSKDPVYLKRLIGYLNFWHQIEPQNRYVIKSLKDLKRLEKH